MSAPTLWEEGRLTASRIVRLAVLAGTLVLAVDIGLNGRVTALFDVAFVLLCVGAALGVRPGDFTGVALLPPLLLAGFVGVLAAIETAWVAQARDVWFQALVSGITHRATGLAIGYALVLAVLVVRLRVGVRRSREAQAKRAGSPAPTRVTSG